MDDAVRLVRRQIVKRGWLIAHDGGGRRGVANAQVLKGRIGRRVATIRGGREHKIYGLSFGQVSGCLVLTLLLRFGLASVNKRNVWVEHRHSGLMRPSSIGHV